MVSAFGSSPLLAAILQLVKRVTATLLTWSPVWIAALLIWQFTTRGLRPAQAEQMRLERAAPAVQERHQRRQGQFEVMAAEREAWDDPVFRERQRRLRMEEKAHGPASLPEQGEHSAPPVKTRR